MHQINLSTFVHHSLYGSQEESRGGGGIPRRCELSFSSLSLLMRLLVEVITKARVSVEKDWVSTYHYASDNDLTARIGVLCQGGF